MAMNVDSQDNALLLVEVRTEPCLIDRLVGCTLRAAAIVAACYFGTLALMVVIGLLL